MPRLPGMSKQQQEKHCHVSDSFLPWSFLVNRLRADRILANNSSNTLQDLSEKDGAIRVTPVASSARAGNKLICVLMAENMPAQRQTVFILLNGHLQAAAFKNTVKNIAVNFDR